VDTTNSARSLFAAHVLCAVAVTSADLPKITYLLVSVIGGLPNGQGRRSSPTAGCDQV
jgi:hypothetical protein